MDNVIFPVKVNNDGSLKIPPFAVRGLGYQPGDSVELALPAEQPECDCCCCDELLIARCRCEAFCDTYSVWDEDVNLPIGLLFSAGVPIGTTLYAMIADGAVVLVAGYGDCEDLPEEIHCLLEELGIDVEMPIPLELEL